MIRLKIKPWEGTIALRIGNFEHKPTALITLLFVLFTAAMLCLGTWQMMRAAEKIEILAAAEQSQAANAVQPGELGDLLVAAKAHTRVTFSGTYDGAHQFLWDNRVHKGQAGFEVITPIRTQAGLVLVNRGWVAPGRTRDDLPNVSLSASLLNAPVNITGLFSRPSKGLVSGEPFDGNSPWPRVMQFFDYAAIELALGESVLAGVIQPQQVASTVGTEQPPRAQKHAEFYTPNWEPTAAIGPVRHYGYAFQWYAMALALTILFIVYNTKRIESVQ